jgi:hypothetical protein
MIATSRRPLQSLQRHDKPDCFRHDFRR